MIIVSDSSIVWQITWINDKVNMARKISQVIKEFVIDWRVCGPEVELFIVLVLGVFQR